MSTVQLERRVIGMVQERRRKQGINRQVGLSVIHCQINSVFSPFRFWCGSASCLVCVSLCLSTSKERIAKGHWQKQTHNRHNGFRRKDGTLLFETFNFLLLWRRAGFQHGNIWFGLEKVPWKIEVLFLFRQQEKNHHHSAVTSSIFDSQMHLDSSQLLLLCSFSSNSLWRWMPPWMPYMKEIVLSTSSVLMLRLHYACRMYEVKGLISAMHVFNLLNDSVLIRRLPEFVLTWFFFKALDPGVVNVPWICHGYPVPFASMAAYCASFQFLG